MVVDRSNEGILCRAQIGGLAGFVGERHPKENRRITTPIVLERVAPFNHARNAHVGKPVELLHELSRLRDSPSQLRHFPTSPSEYHLTSTRIGVCRREIIYTKKPRKQ